MYLRDFLILLLYGLLVILMLLFVLSGIIMGYLNSEEFEIIVSDKYVKGESGQYFIIDENKNAYIIQDLLFKGKFNSTDLYNQMEIGKKYRIETTGYRIHFLSRYKNINKIYELEEK